jgi:energy-coupling factor transport system permease protein
MRSFFYKRKETRFHNLKTEIKFLICAALIVLALILENPVYLAILMAASITIVAEAKISDGWIGYMKMAAWTGVFLVLLNLLLSQSGKTILFEANTGLPLFDTIKITLEALYFGLIIALRLALAISAFAIMSLTISPDEMLCLMSKMRIPAKSVLTASLAARYIPSLAEDAEALTEVQRTRGAKLKGIKGSGTVIIPLLSNSLERSIATAEAMEARGFSGEYEYCGKDDRD